ncbi:GNAT family N-acetyltransferase [Rhodococcus sp. NPDC058639]|uniref:GNAT family N-acetyltransferase n=1 Tax=Rhodococcus sp. NPDC058639 TaxID=3346570 RepID=UPI003648E1DB
MDPHLSSIATLAWCRALGLADTALTTPGAVLRVDATTRTLRILRVGDAVAVVGPESAVSAIAELTPDRIDETAVRNATGGRAVRIEDLGLCADWVDATRVRDPLVSHEAEDLAELLRHCPPDDVTETDLPLAWPSRSFVLLDDDRRPLAGAGYRELHSLLADVRVISAPEYRRLGLAATVTTLATHDALDTGLIPMSRVRRGNVAARGLAAVSGYTEWGTQMTVRLPADP